MSRNCWWTLFCLPARKKSMPRSVWSFPRNSGYTCIFLVFFSVFLKKIVFYHLQQLCTWRTLLLQTDGDTFCSHDLPLPIMSLTFVFDLIVREILGFQKNYRIGRQFGPYFILPLLAPRHSEQYRSSLIYSEPHWWDLSKSENIFLFYCIAEKWRQINRFWTFFSLSAARAGAFEVNKKSIILRHQNVPLFMGHLLGI